MPSKPLSDHMRDAIRASDMSRYTICKAVGWDQGAMSRFMSGRSGLSLETLDRLDDLLGLAIVTRPKASK